MVACNFTMVMEPAILTTRANPKTRLAPGRSHSSCPFFLELWSLFLWEQQAVSQACLLQSGGYVVVIQCWSWIILNHSITLMSIWILTYACRVLYYGKM
ncbi:hypothetical protein VNO77_25617 [Canavalia gladiata]|uniref:Uncharacterized protein n=1 Tax=Canavalia gladiata TaxID=3824 RepID=A0AAN9LBV3_CANGL